MRTSRIITGLVLCGAFAAGCGEDAPEERAAKAEPSATLAERQAQLEQDPYDLRCADLADKVDSARMTRIVQYALADDAKVPGLNRLRASQSIYFAITEICKGKPGSYEPARPAIAGVRSGEYVTDLGSP
jgi:outer membrane murein-binding lipoprotein Lpp